MKFQNPRTGEIYTVREAVGTICSDEENRCEKCCLGEIECSDCNEWVRDNPQEAARLMGFEVIDDSKVVDFDQVIPDQTAKADAGKARLSLVPFQIVYDIARVREYGDMKYGSSDNWKQVELQRYVDALLRHTLAFAEDMHSTDQESGLPHLWHAACNIAFLCELLKEENNGQTL